MWGAFSLLTINYIHIKGVTFRAQLLPINLSVPTEENVTAIPVVFQPVSTKVSNLVCLGNPLLGSFDNSLFCTMQALHTHAQ